MVNMWSTIATLTLIEAGFQQCNWRTIVEGYPKTYQGHKATQPHRPELFDPALKNFPRAFRLGDPAFADPIIRRRWFEVRRRVINGLLRSVTESRWQDQLVLRGSLLLKTWLGDLAREPGDIDWVFQPAMVESNSAIAGELIPDIMGMAYQSLSVGDDQINIGQIFVDDIWTYERADGKRIVVPWQIAGLPLGDVQIDIVFGEQLPERPIRTVIAGIEMPLWSASPQLSLVWKLLWLMTDCYPQGKDLYDAVILAEHYGFPIDLCREVLASHNISVGTDPDSQYWLKTLDGLEWNAFQQEYPGVAGSSSDWIDRLAQALQLTSASDGFV
jgi:Nucleotidyl transferase AbiEii toxin, Type IV TA system